MKRHILSTLLAAGLLFSLSGCGGSAPAAREDGTLRLLATTYPIYLFTTAVTDGVEGVEVARLITQEVSCLHDYTLSVSDMKAIEDADVILQTGAGLEDFMADALAASSAVVIDCSEGVDLLPARGHEDHDHGGEEGDHYDPHYWLSPENAMRAMEGIAHRLSALLPDREDRFRANLETALELVGGNASVCALATAHSSLSPVCTHLEFITFHDGFRYFADAFGLDLLKAIEEEEGAEASAAEIKEVVSLIGEYHIPAVFTEVNGSDSTAKAIARETGVAVYPLDLIMSGDGSGILPYVDAMRSNLQTVAEALK